MSSNAGLLPRALEVDSNRWLRWMWLPVAFAVLAVGLWWLGHPQELPSPDRSIEATAKTGRPLYLGVTDTAQAGRELSIMSVVLPDLSRSGATVEALICINGSIAQTTDPTGFCEDVVPAEGNSLRLGQDQLLLSITSGTAQVLELDRLRVSYAEGLQRAEQRIGPTYAVTFIG
jgi:hypothetical protein